MTLHQLNLENYPKLSQFARVLPNSAREMVQIWQFLQVVISVRITILDRG